VPKFRPTFNEVLTNFRATSGSRRRRHRDFTKLAITCRTNSPPRVWSHRQPCIRVCNAQSATPHFARCSKSKTSTFTGSEPRWTKQLSRSRPTRPYSSAFRQAARHRRLCEPTAAENPEVGKSFPCAAYHTAAKSYIYIRSRRRRRWHRLRTLEAQCYRALASSSRKPPSLTVSTRPAPDRDFSEKCFSTPRFFHRPRQDRTSRPRVGLDVVRAISRSQRRDSTFKHQPASRKPSSTLKVSS